MAAPKSRINTEFYNKNTIELELKGSNFNWWRRGESNPCPKTTWKELLRVQFVIYIPSLRREQTPYGAW